MRPDLVDILVCPVCKAELDLSATETAGDSGEIVEGSLHCSQCDETYPISEGIPDLLPPDQRA